jgi:integral membrane protein (TIGR01906 family)
VTKSASLPTFLARMLVTLAVPVLLTAGSVRLVMTPLWMTLEYTRAGFPPDGYGFSTDDRLQYGIYGIEYLLNGEDIEFLNRRLPIELCFNAPAESDDCAMFNEFELQHMRDVKKVTQAVFVGSLVTAVLAVVVSVVLWRSNRRLLSLALLQGSILTLGMVATIVVIAVTSWNFFFDTFHAMFFESGTWRFFYSDTLIRLYPEQFWFDAALTSGSLITGGALILLGLVWWRLKHFARVR